ncbi:MAG: hypothetical protein FWG66_13310 [Spirochaetes bacterium]|nr:hypothetical protein [Spirochaetota bacterium]
MRRKKIALAVCFAMLLTFAAAPSAQAQGIPSSVQQLMQNMPDDALFAIGVARFAVVHQSITMSQVRARVGIAQTMDSAVRAAILDYFGADELTGAALSFAESISVTLTQADVSGARIVLTEVMPDGTVWSVAVFDRTAVANIVNHAQTQARLAVPMAASFDAQARMEAAFAQRNAGVPVQTVDN